MVRTQSSTNIPSELNPRGRFTGREVDYSVGRPGYPKEIIQFLVKNAGFTKDKVVADIGSGTGKLTSLFLENGNKTYAVEPNRSMREESRRLLNHHDNFHIVPGSAEKTGLPGRSVDLISAGQSFHWFDKKKTKKEFIRILRPGGFVMLVWNTRQQARGTFGYDYEKLIETHQFEKGAWTSGEDQIEAISRFFANRHVKSIKLPNKQVLSFRQLLARIRSASYMPNRGREFQLVRKSAKELFAKYSGNGRVTFLYKTEVYLGKPALTG